MKIKITDLRYIHGGIHVEARDEGNDEMIVDFADPKTPSQEIVNYIKSYYAEKNGLVQVLQEKQFKQMVGMEIII